MGRCPQLLVRRWRLAALGVPPVNGLLRHQAGLLLLQLQLLLGAVLLLLLPELLSLQQDLRVGLLLPGRCQLGQPVLPLLRSFHYVQLLHSALCFQQLFTGWQRRQD